LLHTACSSQPWRFENLFEQDIDSTLLSHKQTTIELSDHLCNDKMLLLDEMQKLKEQLKSLNKKYAKLQKRHEDVLQQLNTCNETSKAQNKTQTLMNRLENDARELKPLAVFILDQLFNYTLKRPKWSEATIRQCIAWRYASPKGYEFARRNGIIRAPSRFTLNRYMGKIQKGKGLSTLIETRLSAEADILQPVEKICSLVVDDMAIKEKLEYSRPDDTFYGASNITKEPLGKRPVLANKLLCFVIHGLSTKYTVPVGYFFHKTLSKDRFFEITMEVIEKVHSCGFRILRIVSDNHKSNVALFKKIGNGALKVRVSHPVDPEFPLFCSFDYCHVVKNARNIFLDHDMSSSTGVITADYLKKLYTMQKSWLIKPVPFLARRHLYPNTFEKMNVLRAVQIFSSGIIAALKYLRKYDSTGFANAQATIEYLEFMHDFFKLHDVSDRTQHFKQLDPKCAPYTECPQKKRRVHNSFIYRRILIIYTPN
jgi:hypothetical protein